MQAIILAAGMGKRLKELTQDRTKCMVQVNGVALIDRMLHQIERRHLSRIVIVVGYEGEKLMEYIDTLGIRTPIVYVHNPIYDKTNNIYSLALAKDYLCQDDTLLFESDLIFEDSVIDQLLDDPRETLALVDKYKSWMDGTCVKLGADVPYCLMRRTALSEGIGEILTPVAPLPDCPILIAKPSISVSTRYVYEHLKLNEETLHPDVDGIVSALKVKDLYGVTDRLGNVLETVTIPEHPVIADIKQQMMQSGAVNALMSGSGPTVFGIFDDEDKAKKAFEDMKASGLARQIYLTRPFNQKIKGTRKNQRKR